MTAPDRPLPLLRNSGHSHTNWNPGVDLVLDLTMQIIVVGHDHADRAGRAPPRAVPFAAQPADRVLRAAHARIHALATAAIEAKAEDEEHATRNAVQVSRRVLLLGELARHVNQRGKGRHRLGRLRAHIVRQYRRGAVLVMMILYFCSVSHVPRQDGAPSGFLCCALAHSLLGFHTNKTLFDTVVSPRESSIVQPRYPSGGTTSVQ